MNNSQNLIHKDNHKSHKLVLIADSDPDYGRALAQAIREETSYYAFYAPDGLQTLKFVEGVKPNLILLGNGLPDMESIEISRQIHRRKKLTQVPILLLHAHTYFSLHNVEKYRPERAGKLHRLETIFDTLQELLA